MLDGKGKFGDLHIVCIRLALRNTKNNSVEIVFIKCKNKLNRKMFFRPISRMEFEHFWF